MTAFIAWLSESVLGRFVAAWGGRWLRNHAVEILSALIDRIKKLFVLKKYEKAGEKLEESISSGTREEQIKQAEDLLSGRN